MPGFAIGLYKVSVSIGVGALLAGWTTIDDSGYWLVLAATAVCAVQYKSFLLSIVLICSWAITINFVMLNTASTPMAEGLYTVEGRIQGLPAEGIRARRFDLVTDHSLSLPDTRLRLRWYNGPPLEPGQRWQLLVKLKNPRNYANPGSFDYRAYLKRQGISLTGYVKKGQLIAQSPGGLEHWRFRLRSRIEQQLSATHAAWASALVLGDHSLLGSAQWEWLRATGTTHLIVVSGMHIGLMAGVGGLIGQALFWLLSFTGRGRRVWFVAGAALMLACCYALITGFGVPAQRALLMLLLALVAWVAGLRLDFRTLLPLVFAAVLWIDPLIMQSPGLWLSFTAVAALMAQFLYQSVTPGRLYGLLLAQLVILISLAPLLLFLGYPVAPLAPLVNLVAIPLIACVLLPLLLLTSLLDLSGLMLAPWSLWSPLFDLMEQSLAAVASVGWVIEPTGQSWWSLLAGGTAALLLLWPGRPCWLPALVIWLSIFWPRQPSVDYGAVRITVLDVGQGLSVLVQSQRHAVLFDTGDRFDQFLLGRAVVEPYLRRRGISQLDLLVLSHQDRDHVGGRDYLTRKFNARKITTGWAENSCHLAPPWHWDGVDFRFLAGHTGLTADNERSCVLLIKVGERYALLTGDIGQARERVLLQDPLWPDRIDLLQVAHHGSSSSSSSEFLAAAPPKVAWISAGYKNRYAHPHPDVVQRLEQYAEVVGSTADDGALEVVLGPMNDFKWRAYLAE